MLLQCKSAFKVYIIYLLTLIGISGELMFLACLLVDTWAPWRLHWRSRPRLQEVLSRMLDSKCFGSAWCLQLAPIVWAPAYARWPQYP